MASIPASHTRPLDAASMSLTVLLCLTWGFNQPIIKLAILEGVPPLMQCAIRSALGMLIVLGIMRWRGLPVLKRDGTLTAGVVAGILFGLEFLLIYRGLIYTAASRATLFIYLAPFFVVLGSRWLFPGARRRGLGRGRAGDQGELAGAHLAGEDAALPGRGLRADRRRRRLGVRRADHRHAVGGRARLARLPDGRARHHVQPVVRPDREVLGEQAFRLHLPDPAVRGGGRPLRAGRAFDPGFCRGRGPGCGRPDTRQPAPIGLYEA